MNYASKAVIFCNYYLFLQLRDYNKAILYPNKWCLFGGGFKNNETPQEAMKRELLEEISFDPLIENYECSFYNLETDTNIYFFFIKIEKLINFKVLEGQKGKWFKHKELAELDLAPDINFINNYLNNNEDLVY